ncbi:MAG: carbohydrate esterase [Flavobacteriaceae bacterium]|nr:carbohydrate esterase [Flavobacteriaceae bacterium]
MANSQILVFTPQLNSRIQYTFDHILHQILGFNLKYTHKIEEFVAFDGPKFSYGKSALGGELFIEEFGLLNEQGFEDIDISVSDWGGLPCFFRVSEQSEVEFDFFSASFYLISRYEEYQPYVKDADEGFPVEESLAHQNDFLHLPLVDLYAHKFFKILKNKFETLTLPKKTSSTTIIFAVETAYAYQEKSFFRQIGGVFYDLYQLKFNSIWDRIQVNFKFKKDPYNVFDKLRKLKNKNEYSFVFLFQVSDFSVKNRNINHNKREYQHLIKSVGDHFKTGLLLGYEALKDISILSEEKDRWEEISKIDLKITGNKKFSLNFPDAYINLGRLGVKQDYSLVYPKKIGFRASTCTPFKFYDLDLEQATPLVIHPCVFNSEALQNTTILEVKRNLLKIRKQIKKVKGEFNLLMENSDYVTIEMKELLNSILKNEEK